MQGYQERRSLRKIDIYYQGQTLQAGKPTILPRPKVPASLMKWNQMLEVNERLEKQNKAIFQVESERNDVYMELASCTGLFKAGKKKKLQEEYDTLTEKISNMKSRLGKIVQEYGYKTVDEF